MSLVSPQVESGSLENKHDKAEVASATRLGQISFINALPIVLPLVRKHVRLDAEQVFANPAELNLMLKSGELQMGAMSSFYFLEDGGFDLFPDISISGSGKVGSVLLFSKFALTELDGKTVSVPRSSATSIKLMQVLLLEELGIKPNLVLADEDSKTEELDACLLIGDKALEFDASGTTLQKTDLAQWWHQRYKLPFVFGVWGARKEWIAENRKDFESIGEALVAACKLGLSSQLAAVISEAQSRTSLSPDRLRSYFLEDLDYRMTMSHHEALALFARLCRKYGLLRE